MNAKEKFELIYSPRTTISNIKENEEKIFNDLKIGFDPYTIKIMKKHYKEHLGKLNKETFISILKRHLLTWHPNLPNREEVLIKLLSRLFDEIDLNSNGDLEWEEFVNYIINSSYHQNYENSLYALQQYSLSKDIIDHQDNDSGINDRFNYMSNKNIDIISHCFFINKYRLIGVAHEAKSRIIFFNAENNKRENFVIDLKDTQNEIDQLELKELNHKTLVKLEKERKDKIEKKNYYNAENFYQLKIGQTNPSKITAITHNKKLNSNNSTGNIKDKLSNKLILGNASNTNEKSNSKRPPTPESIKDEIYRINKEDEKTKHKKLQHNKGLFALCTCFVEDYDLLFISGNNNKISAWHFDYKNNEFKNANKINFKNKSDFYFEINRIQVPLFSTKVPQNTMCFDHTLNCLYSGQENGKILKWEMNSPNYTYIFDIYDEKNKMIINNLSTTKLDYIEINGMSIEKKTNKSKELLSLIKTKSYDNYGEKKSGQEIDREKEEFYRVQNNTKSISNFKHKRDTVSCLLMIERLRLICSSFFNGQIIFWDATSKKPQKVFNDQVTGIYSMVFDPNKNQIFTCGFEHEIFVYEPYNNNNAVYKLKGHNGSISSLAINPTLNELISIDVLGVIKIWDTNLFVNFQTINTNDSLLISQNHIKKPNEVNTLNKKKISSNTFILSFQNLKKILVYGSKLLLYEKGKDKDPNLTDDNPLLGCVYNNLSKDLITFSNKKLKIWNIFTGKVKKSYDNLMKGYEITAFTCDKQMKRFYLGDTNGHVKGFNMSTGDYLKDFSQHENEIVNVIHSSKYEILISCSSDLCVKFQDDKELLNTELIKEIYARPANSFYYGNDYILKLKVSIIDESNGILMIGLSNGTIMHYDVAHYKFFLNPNEEKEVKLTKQIPISSLTDIDEIDVIFVAYDNGEKCFTAKAKNKYYHYLAGEKFGNFIDDEKIANDQNNAKKKNIIISSFYNYKSHILIAGDHIGGVSCYDLMPLYNFMKTNNNAKDEEEIKKIFHNGFNIFLKYRVQIHTDAVKYLHVSDELIPKVIISTSNDKTVKLLDFNNGKYIDTLKQISIKYNSSPIGIKYLKENPFESNAKNENMTEKYNFQNENTKNKNEENNKKYNIIYKENIVSPIELPKINYDEATHNDIVEYYDQISEYNAKIKLLSSSKGQKLPPHKSNPWNYDVNVKLLLEKQENEVQKLINIVNKKESETNKAEKQHQELSIFNNNYSPAFLDNLDRDEKYELKNQINQKIRNINLAISKSIMLQKEMEVIEKFRNRQKNRGLEEEEENDKSNKKQKKTFLKPIANTSKTLDKNKNISFSRYSNNSQSNMIHLNENSTNNKNMSAIDIEKNTKNTTNSVNSISSLNIPKNKAINLRKIRQYNPGISNQRSSSYVDIYRNNSNAIPLADKRFRICKNQFDEKFRELTGPFEYLLRNNRKGNILPKIVKNNII